jgi:hypothetical protein
MEGEEEEEQGEETKPAKAVGTGEWRLIRMDFRRWVGAGSGAFALPAQVLRSGDLHGIMEFRRTFDRRGDRGKFRGSHFWMEGCFHFSRAAPIFPIQNMLQLKTLKPTSVTEYFTGGLPIDLRIRFGRRVGSHRKLSDMQVSSLPSRFDD